MNENYLARARRASGLTQKELGELVGVGRSTISLYEIEEVFPSVPVAKKIGKVLSIDWTRLYDNLQ